MDCEQISDGFVFDSKATKKTKWNEFDISNIMDGNEINLQFTPIIDNTNACIGVRVRSNDGTSFTHQFDSAVDGSTLVSIDCKQIIGIPIKDGKVSYTKD